MFFKLLIIFLYTFSCISEGRDRQERPFRKKLSKDLFDFHKELGNLISFHKPDGDEAQQSSISTYFKIFSLVLFTAGLGLQKNCAESTCSHTCLHCPQYSFSYYLHLALEVPLL